MNQLMPDHVVDAWFQLCDKVFRQEAGPSELRPPSLRDACYASALAMRTNSETTPETIEAFVNGIERGAMSALRAAWNEKREGASQWESHRKI